MDLFNLIGKVTLDTSDYQEKVQEVKEENKKLENGISKMTNKAKIGWAAIAVAVASVTKEIYNQIKAVMDYANGVGDLAKNFGFTNKEIQEFDYWAINSGTNVEELLNSMKSLITNTVSGADKFERLGVAIKDSTGATKSQRDLFLDTVDALQKVESQTERNAYILELFGDSGININQILGKSREELEALTAEGERLGVFISDDTILQAQKYNVEINKLSKQWQGLIASILSDEEDVGDKVDAFVKTLGDKIEDLVPVIIKIGNTLVEALIRGVIQGLPELVKSITEPITRIDWISLGWDIIKGVLTGIWEGFKSLFTWSIGEGWLWGNNGGGNEINTSQTQISTITNSGRIEKTEKVDETLDITLRVESDGTEVSEKNLEVVSDIVVQKINKILGGEL